MFDKLKKALGVDEEEEDYEGEDFPSFVSRGDDAQRAEGNEHPPGALTHHALSSASATRRQPQAPAPPARAPAQAS